MRNRYPGICYRCGERVEVGEGHFERYHGRWRTQHATCAIEHRGTPDPEREALRQRILEARAQDTGKRAQRARQELKRRNGDAGTRDPNHDAHDEQA